MHQNAIYICISWYSKICWFLVNKCWCQQNSRGVLRDWYIFWIFFRQGKSVPSSIIVGYVWQILGRRGLFGHPLIREQPRKGPSWIRLRNLLLSYTFRTPKITGFEEILIYSFLFTRTIFFNTKKTWMENINILKTIIILKILRSNTPAQDVFWTSYIRLIYSLFPLGDIMRYFFYGKWTIITIPINSFMTEVLII